MGETTDPAHKIDQLNYLASWSLMGMQAGQRIEQRREDPPSREQMKGTAQLLTNNDS